MDTISFPWTKLISADDNNGGQTFEEIAFRYVESNYNQFRWIKTQMTRDGNKDAYAIISLFSTKQNKAEIWMEAKFSVAKKNMSRYTIDKTIVSALCCGNVSELFFVTNMLVTHRVKEQVLSALTNDGFEYKDVHFCTKYDLEIWLTNTEKGKKVFSKYFKDCHYKDYHFDGVKLLGSPSFYDVNTNNYLYTEPLSALKSGFCYDAYLQLFSSHNTTVRFNTNNCIDLYSPKQFDLCKGINELALTFNIYNKGSLPCFFIISDGQNDKVELSIPVLNNTTNHIKIKSQETIKEKLSNHFCEYEKTNQDCIIDEITAPAGMGKSFLLEQITGSEFMRKKDIISYTFSSKSLTNNQILAELYLRLFYYSAIIRNDDTVYDNLNIPNELKKLIQLVRENDYKEIEEWMMKSNAWQLIPLDYGKNRIIILDNTERLSESQSLFLMSLIIDLRLSKSHSYILLSGRRRKFSSHNDRIVLNYTDILKTLEYNHIQASAATLSIFKKNVYDVSYLSLFIEELLKVKGHSIEQVLATTRDSETLKHLMVKKIDSVIASTDNYSIELLMIIYTLIDGLSYEQIGDDKKLIQPLIEENLVKCGVDGYLPINSSLCGFYRAQYTSYDIDGVMLKRYFDSFSENERLRFYMGSDIFAHYLGEALQYTNELMNRQDYITVAYILEPLFSPYIKLGIEQDNLSQIGLRYNYIYAKSNVDTFYEIKKEFEKFAKDIECAQDEESIIYRIKALSEVVCFAFEDGDLQKVKELANEVKDMSKKSVTNKEKIKDSLFLCDSIILLSLCSEDNYQEAENYIWYMESIYGDTSLMHIANMRYARCFFHSDIDKAIIIMKETQPLLEEDHDYKWSNACLLDIQFLNYLKGVGVNSIYEGINTLRESLPRFISLYRSNLRLFAACSLVNADGHFDKHSESEFNNFWDDYQCESGCRFAKEIGFDEMIKAAVNYLKEDYIKMKENLEAAKTHFQQLGKSYNTIILHNSNIATNTKPIDKKVLFYNSKNPMNSQYFYLDPRMW